MEQSDPGHDFSLGGDRISDQGGKIPFRIVDYSLARCFYVSSQSDLYPHGRGRFWNRGGNCLAHRDPLCRRLLHRIRSAVSEIKNCDVNGSCATGLASANRYIPGSFHDDSFPISFNPICISKYNFLKIPVYKPNQ